MNNIILISAKARCGKDTTAEIMKEELELLGKKVLICHYADLLKYMCKTFFGWDGVKDEKGRTILQHVGTDVIREKRPNFWVDFIIKVLDLFEDEWDYILIPDTRFPNEINEMKYRFGRFIWVDPEEGYAYNDTRFKVSSVRINRDIESGLTKEQLNHPSETALDDFKFDYYIDNNGTLEDLRDKAKELIDTLETNREES